jgi:ribonuclease P protein component
VVRNRAKRRLREAARLLLPLHGRPAFDYVFVARRGTPDRPWARLLDDVKSALISLAANPARSALADAHSHVSLPKSLPESSGSHG